MVRAKLTIFEIETISNDDKIDNIKRKLENACKKMKENKGIDECKVYVKEI